jgi:hypothetical protein
VVEAEAATLEEVASVNQEVARSLVKDVAEVEAPRVRREINRGARSAGNLIMKQLIASIDLMKTIRMRKDMQQLLHRLTVLIQSGTWIQELPIMSQEN